MCLACHKNVPIRRAPHCMTINWHLKINRSCIIWSFSHAHIRVHSEIVCECVVDFYFLFFFITAGLRKAKQMYIYINKQWKRAYTRECSETKSNSTFINVRKRYDKINKIKSACGQFKYVKHDSYNITVHIIKYAYTCTGCIIIYIIHT